MDSWKIVNKKDIAQNKEVSDFSAASSLDETDLQRSEKLPVFNTELRKNIQTLRVDLVKQNKSPEIRDMLILFNKLEEFSKTIGLDNPPIFNLTIGDIDLLTKEIEPEFGDVPE